MNFNDERPEHNVTDLAIMIRGFTIFSFTWVHCEECGGNIQIVIFNKKVKDFD